MPVVRFVDFPFIRVEYDRSGPRPAAAITRAGSVGVAFTAQSRAVWEFDGKTFEAPFPASVSLTAGSDLVWHRWSDVSEAVEFQLQEDWIERVTGVQNLFQRLEPRIAIRQPVLDSVAARFCRDMFAGTVDKLKFETLAIAALRSIYPPAARLERKSRSVALSAQQMRAVADYVSDHLGEEITLEGLAQVSRMSVFHFAKRFKAGTGSSPYAYVVAQRMIRALQLLRTGRSTVSEVARNVGYRDSRQFRRQFVAHWKLLPGRLDSQV
jgi:AraC family transcriptional regulator